MSNRVGILLYINYNIIFFSDYKLWIPVLFVENCQLRLFVRDILSVTFCPMTLCPICRKMSVATFCPVTFCPWPFVYGFLSCDFLSYIIWLNTRLVFEPRIYRTWFLKFNIMKWIERIRKLVIKVFVQFVNICYEVNVESFGFGVF